MIKKRIKKLFFKVCSVSLICCLLISPVSAAQVFYKDSSLFAVFPYDKKVKDNTQEDDWSDWEDMDESSSGIDVEISTEFAPRLVCENKNYSFWYDTAGADIYVRDKRNGYIWSNTVDDKYYYNEKASRAILTQLLQVSIKDEESQITIKQLCDAKGNENDFTLTPDYDSKGMTLNIEMPKVSVAFDVRFELSEDGLTVSIPQKSIKQNSLCKIANIALMPCFAAARTDKNGYLFIPDGPGALVMFNNNAPKEERIYSYSLYGQESQNLDNLLKRDEQDIKNMMLPVFGIRNQKTGMLAAVTSGGENATLNIVPYGYQCQGLARAYFTFMYLYSETLTVNGKEIEQIMDNQELGDRSVKYFLMDENKCDYSDMAQCYRSYLIDTDGLGDKIKDKKNITLDLFMGVTKNGLFRESFVDMTSFNDAKNIVSDLKNKGIDNLSVTVLGWTKGGFTELPTSSKVSPKLGGKKKMKDLLEWLNKNGVTAYVYNDFFEADAESKTANLRTDVIRDYVGNLITDSKQTTAVMNPYLTFDSKINAARKSGIYKYAKFSLARAGQWLWNNFDKDRLCTRTQTKEKIVSVLKNTYKEDGGLQVYGGNKYVLPYADSIKELPDTASNYSYETYSVPFYQMVVNGYVNYTSIAGNMTYDANYQKLKWIEYGCTPYYIITQKNAIDLVDSNYDKLFSSEYSVWGDIIEETYKEFTGKLKFTGNETIVKHTIVNDDVRIVEYSNSDKIYLNYSKNAVKVEGRTVPAGDYLAVTSKESGEEK